MRLSYHILFLGLVLTVNASSDPTLEKIAELIVLLNDVNDNFGKYTAWFLTSGRSIPTGIVEVYMVVRTATDLSYTSMFTMLDVSALEAMATAVPWYTSYLSSEIEAAIANVDATLYPLTSSTTLITTSSSTSSSTSTNYPTSTISDDVSTTITSTEPSSSSFNAATASQTSSAVVSTSTSTLCNSLASPESILYLGSGSSSTINIPTATSSKNDVSNTTNGASSVSNRKNVGLPKSTSSLTITDPSTTVLTTSISTLSDVILLNPDVSLQSSCTTDIDAVSLSINLSSNFVSFADSYTYATEMVSSNSLNSTMSTSPEESVTSFTNSNGVATAYFTEVNNRTITIITNFIIATKIDTITSCSGGCIENSVVEKETAWTTVTSSLISEESMNTASLVTVNSLTTTTMTVCNERYLYTRSIVSSVVSTVSFTDSIKNIDSIDVATTTTISTYDDAGSSSRYQNSLIPSISTKVELINSRSNSSVEATIGNEASTSSTFVPVSISPKASGSISSVVVQLENIANAKINNIRSAFFGVALLLL